MRIYTSENERLVITKPQMIRNRWKVIGYYPRTNEVAFTFTTKNMLIANKVYEEVS